MYFQATPSSVVALLLIALGVWALLELSKRKLNTNLTILFYVCFFLFLRYSGWELHYGIYLAGLVMALVLRFEFMNGIITSFVLGLEMLAIAALGAWLLLTSFQVRF
jgi:hypothetical protein